MSFCHHDRAPLFYIESINSNKFYARHCESIADIVRGCSGLPLVTMGGEPSNARHNVRGIFHLTTNRSPPFAQGGPSTSNLPWGCKHHYSVILLQFTWLRFIAVVVYVKTSERRRKKKSPERHRFGKIKTDDFHFISSRPTCAEWKAQKRIIRASTETPSWNGVQSDSLEPNNHYYYFLLLLLRFLLSASCSSHTHVG
jgi:hypothetical protein